MSDRKNIGILLLITLITVLTVEFLLHMLFPIRYADILDSYEYSDRLGYKFKKNLYNTESTDHYKEDITNSIGIVNIEEDYSDYNKIIYTIGDSYTKGSGSMYDASYPFFLSLFLNGGKEPNIYFKKDYGVLNLGVPGYGLKQSIIRLDEIRNKSVPPDIICYLGSENDYSDDALFLSGYKHKHLVDNNPFWNKWYMKPLKILQRTQILSRLKLFISIFRQRMIIEKSDSNKESIPNSQKMLLDLNRLIAASKKNDSQLILSWSDPESDSYNWLKTFSKEHNIMFADWHSIAKDYKMNFLPPKEINLHSGGHKRSWVNYIIALSFSHKIDRAGFK